MAEQHVQGMSVAVIKNYRIEWAEGFGLANAKSSAKVSRHTKFQAASISKPIAALAALKLADQGLVDLDTDINNYLSAWQLNYESFSTDQKVTLRHILSHTSGLTVDGFPGYQRGSVYPSDIEILNGQGNTAPVTLGTAPGKEMRYSGGAYTVMELLIEDVAKQSFDSYMAQQILGPLGMKQSTFAQPLPKQQWPQVSAAFDAQGKQLEGDWHGYPEQAAAGLWTTPTDLAKYIIAVQNAVAKRQQTILQAPSVKQMLTPQIGGWGLGPNLSETNSGQVFKHSGKNAGFTNEFIAYSATGDGLVIMANSDGAGPVIEELKLAISAHYGWDLAEAMVIEPSSLNNKFEVAIAGDYVFEQDANLVMSISKAADTYQVHDRTNNERFYFVPTNSDELTNIESGSRIKLTTNEAGQLSGFVWAGRYRFLKQQ
ncbi:hypothetical protein GCM10011369_32410 [Neiella marina]|uniref:Beta-lactamase-related domain-containing protein n=2 Tax=Neiella marina TaxID=508461 RepID=A0A8J2XR62_9GAMM|nr:hypothetical protein GCM10011369_32410 [Neiella marina]